MFILKPHRDFSLNVICAIQAWFIIIIITVWWRNPAAMLHVRPTLWMVFFATRWHTTSSRELNSWKIHIFNVFAFLGNCRGQHFSILIKLQDNKLAQNLELQEWILAKCVHWIDRFNTFKFYAYHLNKDCSWQPEILMYANWIPSIVMCLQVTGWRKSSLLGHKGRNIFQFKYVSKPVYCSIPAVFLWQKKRKEKLPKNEGTLLIPSY